MEVKKAPKANLENKKNIFLEVGFTIALAIVLVSFEWKSPANETQAYVSDFINVDDVDLIPITKFEDPKPLPPPPSLIKDIFVITDDPELSDDDIVIPESDQNEANPAAILPDVNYVTETDEEAPFVVVEEAPEFLAGSVQKWIAKNVKYPVLAQENGITGKVFIQFVIEKDGSISNIKVLRSVDASLDKEAVRVIQSMPKWKPGKQRKQTVRVSYTLPINFQLSSN